MYCWPTSREAILESSLQCIKPVPWCTPHESDGSMSDMCFREMLTTEFKVQVINDFVFYHVWCKVPSMGVCIQSPSQAWLAVRRLMFSKRNSFSVELCVLWSCQCVVQYHFYCSRSGVWDRRGTPPAAGWVGRHWGLSGKHQEVAGPVNVPTWRGCFSLVINL